MTHVGTTIGDYQCGYRRERSTVDQIFSVRQLFEKCSEHGKHTHHLFMDLRRHIVARLDVAYMQPWKR